MTDLSYTILKIDAAGGVVLSYPGRCVTRGPDHITVEAFFALRDRLELGYTVFERGDRMVEHFFSDRWYNVFECHAVGSDALRGWYCNVARPAIIDDVAVDVRQTDLALDVWVAPDRTITILDEDEFAALHLTEQEVAAARGAVAEIRSLVESGAWPFDQA